MKHLSYELPIDKQVVPGGIIVGDVDNDPYGDNEIVVAGICGNLAVYKGRSLGKQVYTLRFYIPVRFLALSHCSTVKITPPPSSALGDGGGSWHHHLHGYR